MGSGEQVMWRVAIPDSFANFLLPTAENLDIENYRCAIPLYPQTLLRQPYIDTASV